MEGIVQVGTKIVRECTMTAVATKDVREAAQYLVAQEEYRLQSRMLAYKAVGSKVGTSTMWVRRFVRGYEGSRLNWAVGERILALRNAYENLCARVEDNNEHLRREILNAATESNNDEHRIAGATMATEDAPLSK